MAKSGEVFSASPVKRKQKGIPVNQDLRARALSRAMAFAVLGAAAALSGCVSSSYAGIALQSELVDPELRSLARKAKAGDRTAKLDLGRRFLQGKGVPQDLRLAERLLLEAADDRGGTRYVYVPGQRGKMGSPQPMNLGPTALGSKEARLLWMQAHSQRLAREEALTTPRDLREDVYIIRRFQTDSRLGAPATSLSPIVNIKGPLSLSGSFRGTGLTAASQKICKLISEIVALYRPYGFSKCNVYGIIRTGPKNTKDQYHFIVVVYSDKYPDSDEYAETAGRLGPMYKPPLSSPLQIPLDISFCANVTYIEIQPVDNELIRPIIGSSQPSYNCETYSRIKRKLD